MTLFSLLQETCLHPDRHIGARLDRLGLLENAVLNYCGGLRSLQHRLQLSLQGPEPVPAELQRLLRDLACYLNEVARAGALPERSADAPVRDADRPPVCLYRGLRDQRASGGDK